MTAIRYTATARTATAAEPITAQGDTPTKAAWQLAHELAQAGEPIDPEQYQRLKRWGFVHLGYTAEWKELFYAVDSSLVE